MHPYMMCLCRCHSVPERFNRKSNYVSVCLLVTICPYAFNSEKRKFMLSLEGHFGVIRIIIRERIEVSSDNFFNVTESFLFSSY